MRQKAPNGYILKNKQRKTISNLTLGKSVRTLISKHECDDGVKK